MTEDTGEQQVEVSEQELIEDGQYQEGRIIRQQQAEIDPSNPPPARTDLVVAAQMQMLE